MIEYHTGDATEPCVSDGIRAIVHICNDAGKWGAGFSGAVSRKWKDPEKKYRAQAKYSKKFKLGELQWTFVETKLTIVNMIAQHDVRSLLDREPIRYDALEKCLHKLGEGARALEEQREKITIHMPRIGCGLAGGKWEYIRPLIEDNLWDFPTYVYDLPKKK